MIITPALPTEVDDLAALVNGAYRGDEARRGWTHEAALLTGQRTDVTMLRDMLAHSATILAARQDARLIGCVAVTAHADRSWTIGMLTVSSARQARGHGATLLDAAEQWISRHGGVAASMTVIHVRDELIAWYERRGYKRTGDTAPFPSDNKRFGEPLRADLHFVVLEKILRPEHQSP